MNILINASNLSGGGGGQVADSICNMLWKYPGHNFTVVLSDALTNTGNNIKNFPNVKVIKYNYPTKDIKSLLTGKNSFLDNVVSTNSIDCVLTVFGPMKWIPRKPHICGFALSHLVIPESPYFKRMRLKEYLSSKRFILINSFIFGRAKVLFTENPYITKRVSDKFRKAKVFTVTNYYNQIFDTPDRQVFRKLPDFSGKTFLSISTPYPHKNLPITIDIAKILIDEHPEFNFRFVLTINTNQFPTISDELRPHFEFVGKVSINECPSLYEQSDVAFVPTLLECFTATYPESMRMGLPIVTTDLEFAHGLCGDAALYYDALNSKDAADLLFKVATNSDVAKRLADNGAKKLSDYDDYNTRTDKLISICETITRS